MSYSIPGQPWQGRVQGHLDRLQQARAEIFDESRKRSAPVEPTDGLDNAKRQRLDANLSTPTPPMNQIGKPPGPMTLAQIFTLTQDPTMIKDVSQTAKPALDRIIEPLLRNVDRQKLDIAINVCAYVPPSSTLARSASAFVPRNGALTSSQTVRARWLALSQLQQQVPVPTGPPQPAAAQTTQVMNQMGHGPAEVPPIEAPAELNLGPLVIPQPPPLAPTQVATCKPPLAICLRTDTDVQTRRQSHPRPRPQHSQQPRKHENCQETTRLQPPRRKLP